MCRIGWGTWETSQVGPVGPLVHKWTCLSGLCCAGGKFKKKLLWQAGGRGWEEERHQKDRTQ